MSFMRGFNTQGGSGPLRQNRRKFWLTISVLSTLSLGLSLSTCKRGTDDASLKATPYDATGFTKQTTLDTSLRQYYLTTVFDDNAKGILQPLTATKPGIVDIGVNIEDSVALPTDAAGTILYPETALLKGQTGNWDQISNSNDFPWNGNGQQYANTNGKATIGAGETFAVAVGQTNPPLNGRTIATFNINHTPLNAATNGKFSLDAPFNLSLIHI